LIEHKPSAWPDHPPVGSVTVSVSFFSGELSVEVPLSQLEPIDPEESTKEAIGDWHYWVSQGYWL
jgi:hypothetical protein